MLDSVRQGSGECFWCGEESDDGATFKRDGKEDFLCKKDFWTFLKNQNGNGKKKVQGNGAAKTMEQKVS